LRIVEPEDEDADVGEKLPLPSVSYDWCETKKRSIPSYLPRQGMKNILFPSGQFVEILC